MASSASAALIPIAQLQWLDGTISIINQTGTDSTDDFPVTDLLTFNAVNLTEFSLTLPDFEVNLNSLDSFNWTIFGPIIAELSGSVVPTGLVSLFSGTNAAWNGQWNIISGNLVGPDGLSPIAFALDENSFWETALIYVEAEAAVPEPMTVGLFATGMAGLLLRRRAARR